MTNDPDDWRHFRRQRNKYNNDIKTAKKKYYYNKLWSTIKDMTNSCNKTPPRHIDHDNRPVTSLRKIADIANDIILTKLTR